MVYYSLKENFSVKQPDFNNSGKILNLDDLKDEMVKNEESYKKIREENLKKIMQFNDNLTTEINKNFKKISKVNKSNDVIEQSKHIFKPMMCHLMEEKRNHNIGINNYNQQNKKQIEEIQEKNNQLLYQEHKHNESLKLLELAIEQKKRNIKSLQNQEKDINNLNQKQKNQNNLFYMVNLGVFGFVMLGILFMFFGSIITKKMKKNKQKKVVKNLFNNSNKNSNGK